MRSRAGSLSKPGNLAASLDRIVRAAQETVPGADEASITVRHADGHLETSAATSDIVLRADELQYELREGPCYDAVTKEDATAPGEKATQSRDMSHDAR